MLVQARGTLIAVRLVPTPSSYSNLLSTPPRMSASRRVLLSPFPLLSPLRDSEYRSGLSYACGVSRLAKGTHARACTERAHVRTGAPGRSVGWPAGRSRRRYIRRRLLFSLCVRECRLMHVHLSPRIHRFGWCMDQSWHANARREPRAVSDTMLERSVPHLFSSFFFSIPSPRRALASDISSYILAISILFTIFFFPSLL